MASIPTTSTRPRGDLESRRRSRSAERYHRDERRHESDSRRSRSPARRPRSSERYVREREEVREVRRRGGRSRSPRRRSNERETEKEKRGKDRSQSPHRRRRSRSRSRSSTPSSSSSVDRERRHRKKEKEHKHKKRSSRSRERRDRKKERKERKKKQKTNAVTGQWGQYGIINELDLYNKEAEFRTWLMEECKINPETITKDQNKKRFAQYVEDYNTATLPHEKYYDMSIYERRMALLRNGETLPYVDETYDANKDFEAHLKSHRKPTSEKDSFLSKEQLKELRRVQHERLEAGKLRSLGLEVPQSMGVRMDGNEFED